MRYQNCGLAVIFALIPLLVYRVESADDSSSSDDSDECKLRPPKQTDKPPTPCCNTKDILSVMDNGISVCKTKMQMGGPPPPPPTGSPSGSRSSGTRPSSSSSSSSSNNQGPQGGGPLNLDKVACFEECVFNETGLLTNGKINKDAVMRIISSDLAQSDWGSILTDANKKCLESYSKNIKENQTCKSGALELKGCFLRELFMNCPKTHWTNSDDCGELKAQLQKCPKLTVPSLHGLPPPKPPTETIN